MSILGLGFDATDIPRVREVFARYGERFLHRVFTDGEIAYCTRHRDPVPSLAARFAAKEAAMKARRSLLTITHAEALAMAQVLLVDD